MLQQQEFWISQSGVGYALSGSLIQALPRLNQGVARTVLIQGSRSSSKLPGGQQNSVPCSCWTEVPIILLAVGSQRLFPFLAVSLFHTQGGHSMSVSSRPAGDALTCNHSGKSWTRHNCKKKTNPLPTAQTHTVHIITHLIRTLFKHWEAVRLRSVNTSFLNFTFPLESLNFVIGIKSRELFSLELQGSFVHFPPRQ